MRDAFADTFARHGDAGAAVCVYQGGQPVVDLAAGVTAAGRPYARETIQPFMSVSKGIVAIAANMLADQGMLDLDAPVARRWPEFAQAGKQPIPVRWLLTHQAGLAALDGRLSRTELLSWTPVIEALEDQSPNWPPGTAHGYHSMTYGFLVGEVIRRVTGQFPGPWIARARTGRKPEPAASYESFTSDLRLPGDTTVVGGQEKKPGSRGDVR